jgi:hypothetical protein
MSMPRAVRRTLLAPLAIVALLALPASPAMAADFNDVPPSHWAYTAITYVAKTNLWMDDFGSSTFKPDDNELRKFWARTLVEIFAPSEPIDPSLHFSDLPDSDPFFKFANVAVKLDWIAEKSGNSFKPGGTIPKSVFDRSLVLALGKADADYGQAIDGIANLHELDGTPYEVPNKVPYYQIADMMNFHYNHSDDTQDVLSTTAMQRDEAAYSLWKAKTLQSWQILKLDKFDNIALGSLTGSGVDADKHDMIQYAMEQIGLYPYIFSGEWKSVPPQGYCCGTQPKGGMDCSGYIWWVMKQKELVGSVNYDAAQFHPSYAGWSLPERSSSQMAQYTPTHITYGSLKIGDLMFFASNYGSGYADVDHVGIYVGNGWMIHVGSSSDGALFDRVDTGYYYDTFVWGRRLGGMAPDAPHGSPYGGDRL